MERMRGRSTEETAESMRVLIRHSQKQVCAGALDVQLAGDAVYFGKIHKKEFIGDPLRKIEAEDIPRAGRLMYVTTVLMLLVFGGTNY